MKRGILFLLVFIFSLTSVSAITFTGYINGDLSKPVTISSASISNSCEGLSNSNCYVYGQQYGNMAQCFDCDTFGPSYNNYDSVGDTGRFCFWDYSTSKCYNGISYGNALPVSGGYNPGCNGNLQCFWGTPTDPDCNWIKGSWVSRSGFCAGGYIEYPTTRQDCDGSEDYYGRGFFTSGSINYQIPTVSLYDNNGMCFDTCYQNGGAVVDTELCTPGSTATGHLDQADDYNCPKTTYSDECLNSTTWRDYSCDGAPSYNPGDIGYDYLSVHGWLGGTDAIYNDVDCTSVYPGGSPVCISNCGSLPSGAGNDICKASQLAGTCSGFYNNCIEGTRPDLDDSQTLVNEFNNLCGPAYLGDVQWAQGGALNSYNFFSGAVGNYGEYRNSFGWIVYVDITTTPATFYNLTMGRGDFDWAACGDDEQEYNIGGLCCDDPTDYITYIPDANLSDPLDVAGDYCVNQGGCGDGVVVPGEECDAKYAQNTMYVINPWQMVSNETVLVLGDDSACAVDEMCNDNCACVLQEDYLNGTPAGICGDNAIQDPNSDGVSEECDGLNLDNQTCITQGFAEGNISCYPSDHGSECTFNTDDCVSAPANIVGPNEYLVYEDCEDDGDGDEYGVATTSLYSGNGNFLSNQSTVCALEVEEVPFFGEGFLIMFLLVIFTFYRKNF